MNIIPTAINRYIQCHSLKQAQVLLGTAWITKLSVQVWQSFVLWKVRIILVSTKSLHILHSFKRSLWSAEKFLAKRLCSIELVGSATSKVDNHCHCWTLATLTNRTELLKWDVLFIWFVGLNLRITFVPEVISRSNHANIINKIKQK